MGKSHRLDLTGKRFGNLVALYPVEQRKYRNIAWRCRCDCGNEVEIASSSLVRKTIPTRSCGCLKDKNMTKAREHIIHYNKGFGTSSLNSVYREYKRQATKRNLDFNLTKDEFTELIKRNCFYCGSQPKNYRNDKETYGSLIYNGIDRIDNLKGYNLDNCVPCCKQCNYAKGKLSQNDFYDWIRNAALTVFGVPI